MKNHLSDDEKMPTFVNPPPVQEMNSGESKESEPSATSSEHGEHINLELQPVENR